jgi:hypothetical protein
VPGDTRRVARRRVGREGDGSRGSLDGRASRRRVEERFPKEHMVVGYERVYETVVSA